MPSGEVCAAAGAGFRAEVQQEARRITSSRQFAGC